VLVIAWFANPKRMSAIIGAIACLASVSLGAGHASAAGTYQAAVIAQGTSTMNSPDDITAMGGHLFVTFQNGVGAMGEPSPSGNTASSVVEYGLDGKLIAKWDVTGKCDGLTADPQLHRIVGTLNEDGNSSLFTIDPDAPASSQVQHYTYSPSRLSHGGGTDAISIHHGQILISASAPNPAPADVPAVYEADLAGGVATLHPVFSDEASAVVANSGPQKGQSTKLALTDPDSSEVVPGPAGRFQGDFMLNSQGDQQLVFLHGSGAGQKLSVLNISQSIDDTAWVAGGSGTLYATDSAKNEVVAIHGDFDPGTGFVAVTPGNANNAPPNPGPNYLGTLSLQTGAVSPVPGLTVQPKGLLFLANGQNDAPSDDNSQGNE
jgi:hypothetical protein